MPAAAVEARRGLIETRTPLGVERRAEVTVPGHAGPLRDGNEKAPAVVDALAI